MSDPFALLGLNPRPALDQELLRDAYLRAASIIHPDAPGGDTAQFTALKNAFDTLRDPAARLRVLAGEGEADSPVDGDLFLRVGAAVAKAREAFTASQATSALARAVAAGKITSASAALAAVLEEVLAARQDAERELAALDHAWPGVDAKSLRSLSSKFRFLGRWESELSERRFELDQACREILPPGTPPPSHHA